MFGDYLLRVYKNTISEILTSNDIVKSSSINIPFLSLWEEDSALAQLLLNSPEEAYKILNKQLQSVQTEILTDLTLTSMSTNASALESYTQFQGYIHVRVYDLYFCSELNRHVFPLREEASYLQISGVTVSDVDLRTVTRISAVKLLRYKRDFQCQKCKQCLTMTAAYEQMYTIIAPRRCSNEECNGIKLIELEEMQQTYSKDYQEIKIQEDLTLLGSGIMPNSMWVTLEDDLVDVCKPGDSVTVCGIVKRRWSALTKGKRCEVSLAFKAYHVAINNIPSATAQHATRADFEAFWRQHRQRPGGELRARDMVLRSFSPEIHGLYLVKLAVAVVLAGGGDGGAAEERTEPHLLLVGDPGTGKSQLLRQAARVIRRSVCTTGIGSTSAGLTVTTIMENGEWQLEAGALVLSDGGICCIDEFHTMRGHDRTSIHEAMEQQSISVAKASIVCKLNTRCSILAAANPQGPFDASQSLSCNIALASPLLSRFDVILLLKDRVDVENDTRVADFVLHSYRRKPEGKPTLDQTWSLDTLQDYYTEIRKRKPYLTPRVTPILNAYYQYRRKSKFRNEARTTVRLLDSLARLSKAHAKLMYRNEVSVVDAVMAIALLEASAETDTPGAPEPTFDSLIDFPDDPAAWYQRVQEVIFDRLHLDVHHFQEESFREKCSQDVNDVHHCTTLGEPLNDISSSQARTSTILESAMSGHFKHHVVEEIFQGWPNSDHSGVEKSTQKNREHCEIPVMEAQKTQTSERVVTVDEWRDPEEANVGVFEEVVSTEREENMGQIEVDMRTLAAADVSTVREENMGQIEVDMRTLAAAERRSSLKRRFGYLARNSNGGGSTMTVTMENANEIILPDSGLSEPASTSTASNTFSIGAERIDDDVDLELGF